MINLTFDKILKKKLTVKALVFITDTVNKYLMLAEYKVRDKQFKKYKLGIT